MNRDNTNLIASVSAAVLGLLVVVLLAAGKLTPEQAAVVVDKLPCPPPAVQAVDEAPAPPTPQDEAPPAPDGVTE